MTRRTYKAGEAGIPGSEAPFRNPEAPTAPPPNPPTPPVAAVSADKSLMRRALEFLLLTGVSAVAGGVAWEWYKRRRMSKSDDEPLALPPVGGTQNHGPANMFGGGLTVMPLPMPMMMPNMMPNMGYPPPQQQFQMPPVHTPMPEYRDRGPSKKDSKPLTAREELQLLRAREKERKHKDMEEAMNLFQEGDDY